MISLLLQLKGPYEKIWGYLQSDLESIQSAINQRWNATFGDANVLPPAAGGTGVTTLPLHGVVIGEGTSPVTSAVGGTGTVLTGVTSADPVFSNSPHLTGTLAVDGVTTVGAGTGISLVVLNGAAGSAKRVFGETAGLGRWAMFLGNATAETGANAGSDFQLAASSDAGGGIDSPITIARVAGGTMALSRPITAAAGAAITGVLSLPSVAGFYHLLSGHKWFQGDATHTYMYGGSGGIQIRKSDDSVSLVTILDNGNTSFDVGTVTAAVGGFSGVFTFTTSASNFGTSLLHTIGGHNFLQGDATITYLYGGTGGLQMRKSDNSVANIEFFDNGNVTFDTGVITATVGGFAGKFNLSTASNFGTGILHTIGGHNYLQGDATLTYLYGGSGGMQIRKTDNSASVITITNTGVITQVAGVTTTGNIGVSTTVASAPVTGQVAANASIAAVTVGAADATYRVSANVNVTAAVTASFSVTCAYTDETNTARVLTLPFVQLGGVTLVGTITNVTGTGPYEGVALTLRCKAGTTITLATSGASFVSVTYNVTPLIEQAA